MISGATVTCTYICCKRIVSSQKSNASIWDPAHLQCVLQHLLLDACCLGVWSCKLEFTCASLCRTLELKHQSQKLSNFRPAFLTCSPEFCGARYKRRVCKYTRRRYGHIKGEQMVRCGMLANLGTAFAHHACEPYLWR